jgi:hypothetical protein
MSQSRDEFPKSVVEALAKRAAFICSNPDCRALTIAPSDLDESKFIYIGKAAHICAAAIGGPRYEAQMRAEKRKSASNGVFLCSSCADMIDKNNGLDFPKEMLRRWKDEHERWVAANLNKRQSPTDAEYNKRVMDRLAKLSDELYSEFNPACEDYLKTHHGLVAALAIIHHDFKQAKDAILADGEWRGWVILPADTFRFEKILEPVRSDPFIPDSIRKVVIELLESRLDAFTEVSGMELDEYRNALASGEMEPDEENWVPIMNQINAEMTKRNCGPAQIEDAVHKIRRMIQDYLK